MKNSNLILEIIDEDNENNNEEQSQTCSTCRKDLVNIMTWINSEIEDIHKMYNKKISKLNKRISDLEKIHTNIDTPIKYKNTSRKIPISTVVVFDKLHNYYSLSGDTFYFKNQIKEYNGIWSEKNRHWIF